MRVSSLRYGFISVALALASVSCSGKARPVVYPVKGKVLVKDQPAAGVVLTFFQVPSDPAAICPVAKSDADGTFVVMTDDQDGAPAGEYMVTAIWLQEKEVPNAKKGEAVSMRMAGDPSDKLGGKYSDRRNGVKVTIKAGPNELEPIKLK